MAQGGAAGDGHPSDDDDRQLADEGQRKSVPLAAAASDPTDRLSGEVRPAGRFKRGPLDLKTLEVEMFGFELEDILQAKRATIRVTIGPPDNRGWVPVRAVSYLTSVDRQARR